MTIQEKAKAARDLANELYKGPCPRAASSPHINQCLETERMRPLKGADDRLRPRGELVGRLVPGRGFAQYDPARLCNDCLAYWYAEMAAQTLERNACFAKEEKP